MQLASDQSSSSQSGFTFIEMMIVIAIVGVLASVAVISYQTYIRKAQVTTIYQEINHFRMPYETLMNEGAGVTDFSPDGLNMPKQTKYCQFTVMPPNSNKITDNAIVCTIQNLSYMQGQSLSLDLATDGSWQCRASIGIPKAYLPKSCQ